jgi:hypothetical protein
VRVPIHQTTTQPLVSPARELEKTLSVNLAQWNKVAIANGFDPV